MINTVLEDSRSPDSRLLSISGADKLIFGRDRRSKDLIYIEKPRIACGWYWGFGYLGNDNCHYHLSSFREGGITANQNTTRNVCMHDCLLEDYALNPHIEKNLWQITELAKSIYTLKASAELFHRGGSHQATNVGKDYLKDMELYEKLHYEYIPRQCQAFWDIISGG